MRWIKSWGLAALTTAAIAGLAASPAHAGNVLNMQLKGSSISGNFGTTQPLDCGNGTHATLFTFVSWNAFQGQERDKGGVLTTMLNAGVFIQQNDNCTGAITQDFAFVDSGVTLTVNGIKSATLSGQFPLQVSGGVLTMNLTVSSTGNTQTGMSLTRSNMGPVLFTQRSTGTSTDASSVSGTVALDGQNIPLVNLSDVGGSIFNNKSGTLLVIGARTFQ
jgi:hypothetical protein